MNLLCLSPGRVLMSEGSPRTAERPERAGVGVLTTTYDELQKNGGGIHCSTTELVRDPAQGSGAHFCCSHAAHIGG